LLWLQNYGKAQMTAARLPPGQGGYRVLFWTIAGLLVLRPIIDQVADQPWLFSIFLSTVLLAGVWAISQNRRQLIALAVLAVVAMGGLLGDLMLDWTTRYSVAMIAATIYFAWIAMILSRDVFKESRRVSADMVYGGINVYLLAGLAFGSAFAALATIVPGSFNGLGADSPFGDAIYYSIVTITTLGYGEITPVSPIARMLASSEALLGQLYVAILLARLVAVHISSGQDAG